VVKPVSLRKIESAITSSIPVVQIHRALTPSSHGRCDFSELMRLNNGSQLVAEFGVGLNGAWDAISSLLGTDPMPSDKVARESHAFRSRLLAVHAEEAAEQVALFEEASRRGDREICLRLAEVITELVSEVAEAAKLQSPSLN